MAFPACPLPGVDIYVIEANKPAGAPELHLDIPEDSYMDTVAGIRITGTSTASRVNVAAVIPGAVIDQQWLEVSGGKFAYTLNPKAIESRTQTYDTAHRVTGIPTIGDVIHLTFFSKEEGPQSAWHSYRRVIVRGTRLLNIK